MRRTMGFTLVELMVVVGIIGILATLAIPAFHLYLMKSRASEASEMFTTMRLGAVGYFNAEWGSRDVGGEALTHCVLDTSGNTVPLTPGLATSVAEVGQKRFGDFSDTPWEHIGLSDTGNYYYSYWLDTAGKSADSQCGSDLVPSADVSFGGGDWVYMFQAVYPAGVGFNFDHALALPVGVRDGQLFTAGGIHRVDFQ